MLGALWLPQHQLHRHLKLEQHQQHLLGQAAARGTSSEHKTSASSPRTEAPGICLAPGSPRQTPPHRWVPGGRDCFSFSAFSLSVMTSVYRYRLQRTLNFTLSLFFLILTAAGLGNGLAGQRQPPPAPETFLYSVLQTTPGEKRFLQIKPYAPHSNFSPVSPPAGNTTAAPPARSKTQPEELRPHRDSSREQPQGSAHHRSHPRGFPRRPALLPSPFCFAGEVYDRQRQKLIVSQISSGA